MRTACVRVRARACACGCVVRSLVRGGAGTVDRGAAHHARPETPRDHGERERECILYNHLTSYLSYNTPYIYITYICTIYYIQVYISVYIIYLYIIYCTYVLVERHPSSRIPTRSWRGTTTTTTATTTGKQLERKEAPPAVTPTNMRATFFLTLLALFCLPRRCQPAGPRQPDPVLSAEDDAAGTEVDGRASRRRAPGPPVAAEHCGQLSSVTKNRGRQGDHQRYSGLTAKKNNLAKAVEEEKLAALNKDAEQDRCQGRATRRPRTQEGRGQPEVDDTSSMPSELEAKVGRWRQQQGDGGDGASGTSGPAVV